MRLPGLAARALALAALLLLTGADAATEFSNAGSLQGWDGRSLEKGTKGTIEEATDASAPSAPKVLKMTQVYQPGYAGRYHAEVFYSKGYRRGQTKFYGFSFKLAKGWQFSPAQNYNLAQFIADFSRTGCDDWMPSTMVYLVGDRLSTRARSGSVCKQKTDAFPVGTVRADTWHRLVMQVKWSSGPDGVFKVWLDGRLAVDKSGLATTVSDEGEFSFRVGLYANGWHDDKEMRGTQGTRSVFYDDIAVGSALADVEGKVGSGGNSTDGENSADGGNGTSPAGSRGSGGSGRSSG